MGLTMMIDGPVNETILRKEFGLQLYDEGIAIAQHDGVSLHTEITQSIRLYSVRDRNSEHLVLVRDHAGGRIMLDCDCEDGKCGHMVAALMSSTSVKPADECDPAVITELEEKISTIVEDIISDPDYDDDANYYDDWEIRKYDLENDNYDVEFDHVSKLLGRILNEIGNPDTAVLLIDTMLTELSDMEFDNGGVNSAISKYDSDISTLFTHISPETIALVLENDTYYAEICYERYLEHVSRKRMDEAYVLLDNSISQSDAALEMHFDRRDFDSYIGCSKLKRDAIVRVVRFLDDEGDDSAKRYAGMLVDHTNGFDDTTAAEMLSDHGFKEEAARMYKAMFKSSHRYSDYENMCRNTESIDTDGLICELASATFSRDTYDIPALLTLVCTGRAKDVADYVLKKGYVPKRTYKYIECRGTGELCEKLIDNGFPEAAATVGRGLIELRLNVKDPNCYTDAVDMLKFMDSDDRFEKIAKPHSEFYRDLKENYPKMRKFWGLYNGTWQDPKARNSWW